MLMILARLVRSESFWAVAKVRSPHTGPGIRYIIGLLFLTVAKGVSLMVSEGYTKLAPSFASGTDKAEPSPLAQNLFSQARKHPRVAAIGKIIYGDSYDMIRANERVDEQRLLVRLERRERAQRRRRGRPVAAKPGRAAGEGEGTTRASGPRRMMPVVVVYSRMVS